MSNLMPNHYLNQRSFIIKWTLPNTHWNLNTNIFYQENAFQNVIWNAVGHFPPLASMCQADTISTNEQSPTIGFMEPLANRLLHRTLLAVRLSVGCGIWPQIGWIHPLVIGWSKYRLRKTSSALNFGSCDWWEFPPIFTAHWQSPCTGLTAGNLPIVSAMQEDCERV